MARNGFNGGSMFQKGTPIEVKICLVMNYLFSIFLNKGSGFLSKWDTIIHQNLNKEGLFSQVVSWEDQLFSSQRNRVFSLGSTAAVTALELCKSKLQREFYSSASGHKFVTPQYLMRRYNITKLKLQRFWWWNASCSCKKSRRQRNHYASLHDID